MNSAFYIPCYFPVRWKFFEEADKVHLLYGPSYVILCVGNLTEENSMLFSCTLNNFWGSRWSPSTLRTKLSHTLCRQPNEWKVLCCYKLYHYDVKVYATKWLMTRSRSHIRWSITIPFELHTNIGYIGVATTKIFAQPFSCRRVRTKFHIFNIRYLHGLVFKYGSFLFSLRKLAVLIKLHDFILLKNCLLMHDSDWRVTATGT
jgi:hypothetical protein